MYANLWANLRAEFSLPLLQRWRKEGRTHFSHLKPAINVTGFYIWFLLDIGQQSLKLLGESTVAG